MKRIMLSVAASALAVGVGLASEVPLDVHAVALVSNDVPAGVTRTLGEDVRLTERTTILKTGEGTLVAPASAAGLIPLAVQAKAGKVAYSNDLPAVRAVGGPVEKPRNVRLGAYGFGSDFLHDEAHVAELAECQLDFVTGVQGSDAATLKLFRSYGVQAVAAGVVSAWGGLASTNDMAAAFPLSRYEAQMDAYTKGTVNPAICSLTLSDEPHASAFDHLGAVVAYIDGRAPETPAYVNLYPNYATNDKSVPAGQKSQLGTDTYQEHIDLYCQKVPTKYISYDHYPIRDDANVMMTTFIPRMYENYRIVADACRRTDREFWYIAQLNTAPGQTKKTSLDQLRYQAWTSMAYGAVSIAWGCWGLGWWTDNVYDTDNVRNDDQFEKLKAVDAEIKRVGARYMAFRNTATRFVDFGEGYASAAAQGAFADVAADDRSPVLVGEMTAREGDAEAIFVVAAGNPTNGVARMHTVRFRAAGAIAAVGPNGPIKLTDGGDGTYSFELRDNDCALVTKDYAEPAADAPDAPPTLSDAVKAKLAFWGSVKDEEHLAFSFGGGLAKWYDVRETDMEHPKFVRLETVFTNYTETLASSGPTIETGEYVCKYSSETNRQTMAYFGGYGSGTTMRFVNTDGKAYKKRPMELSSVYGYTGGDFGFLFGNCMQTTEHRLWNEGNGLPWASTWGSVCGDTQVWIDGEKVDRSIGTLPKGFHALHTRVNTLTTENLDLFENALFSIHHDRASRGGQYVGEVMFFTNRLTYAERGEVQRYMDRKWFGRKPSTVKVALESGAELDVVAESDAVASLQATGDGRFVKKGDGTLIYHPNDFDASPSAAVSIEGGAVSANRAVSVAVTAGQKLTAAHPANPTAEATVGVTLTAGAADAADTVEKDGLGYAAIGAIPSGTKNLKVTSGTLALKPVRAPVRRYEVAIPNGDFSDWRGNTTLGNIRVDACGWSQTGSSVGFYDYDKWMSGLTGGPFGAGVTITAYTFHTCPPPEGRCVLMIKMLGNSARAPGIVFPEPGEYELSFLLTSRDSVSKKSRVHTYLTSADNKTIDLGLAYAMTIKEWTDQKTFRFSVADANATYTLHFDHVSPWYDGKTDRDVTVLINSLHLYRIGDQAVAYKIPGGDFEDVKGMNTDGIISAVDGTATVDGWTFDTTVTESYCQSGVTDYYTYTQGGRRYGSGFNCSQRPLGGDHQLLIRRAGGFAQATFTPPKGKWYLKAYAALWGEYSSGNGGPRVNATVAAGGATTDLGALQLPKSWTMQPQVWATPFEADGATEVTLTVTFNGDTGMRGVHLDDFTLVGEYENPYELVQNGDFEAPVFADRGYPGARTGWAFLSTSVPDGVDDKGKPKNKVLGDCIPREYGRDDVPHFGTDHGSGNCFMEPYNSGGVGGFYQDVAFPHAGWYRLSYLAKTRANAGDSSSAVEVQLVDVAKSETNRLDVIDRLAKGVYSQRTTLFHVDAAPVTNRLLFLCVKSGSYPAFDDISIRYEGARAADAFASPDDAEIDERGLVVTVAQGAYLQLDFTGTNRVSRLVVNGVRQSAGVVNAANCPSVVGPGSLLVKPRNIGGGIFVK